MDTSALVTALTANGLSPYTSLINRLALPSLLLTATSILGGSITVGASRLGGLPDLPPEQAWPLMNGTPMSFVAQIRLEDTHGLDGGATLPADGLLSFFYDASQQTYGSDPNDRAGFSVLYFDPAAQARLKHVEAWPATLPAAARFTAATLAFTLEVSYTQDLQAEFPDRQVSPDEQQRFESALAQMTPPATMTPRHRLLGHPDTIQDDMRQECQFATNGVADPSADPERTAALVASANDWRLLLQVDSDARLGMRWASAGMLYFWIRQQDLSSGIFSNCWVVLQSD